MIDTKILLISVLTALILDAIVRWVSVAKTFKLIDEVDKRVTDHKDGCNSHYIDDVKDTVNDLEYKQELMEEYLGIELAEPPEPPEPKPAMYVRKPGLNDHKKEGAR